MRPVLIEKPWGVTAFGAASVRAAPDVARVRASVIRIEQTPAKAFGSTNVAVQAVRDSLRKIGVQDSAVHGSRLGLASAWDGYGEQRKFLGYRCSASFVIELVDLDRLQHMLVEIVAAGAHHVDGVEFDVRDKPALRAQARRDAVEAAKRKAELLAEAAGVKLGSVIHIEDVDPERLEREQYGHGVGGASATDTLAPGHVVVAAAIALGFSIAH